MSRDIWSPQQYRAYASHRARPFFELLSRIDLTAPAYVVDLGCGPGERTADLAARWPGAIIDGIDSSSEMITEARRMIRELSGSRNGAADDLLTGAGAGAGAGADIEPNENNAEVKRAAGPADPVDASDPGARVYGGSGGAGGLGGAGPLDRLGDAAGLGGLGDSSRGGLGGQAGPADLRDPGDSPGDLRFSVGDLAEWTPKRPVDVIFSNAALQWVPGHQRLLPKWVEALAPGGRLAFSMPGNFDGPSHRILRELCQSARWRDRLGQVNRHNIVGNPADYFELLSDEGCDVDAWETTYLQVLHGTDPVLEWMKGTALRPALDALPEEGAREEFLAELTLLLRESYPPGPHGTLFPFRRIFVVASRPDTAATPRSS
jgi:trans-aconitate methyltransferase